PVRRRSPERRRHLHVHVAPGADGADAVAAPALRPAEIVADPELAAHERWLLLTEPEAAPLAGLADDGGISCRAEEDDRLLEPLQSPPDRLRRRCQVRELRVPLQERELDRVGRPVPVLGEMDFGQPLLVALVVVVL